MAQPWLTDISDRTKPRLVSQMALAINKPENCTAALQSGTSATVHYHDVDDPYDTTFVMASMWNAGIRIWDVRKPEKPTELYLSKLEGVDIALRHKFKKLYQYY